MPFLKRHIPLGRIHQYSGQLLALSVLWAIAFFLLFEPWDGTGAERVTHFSRGASLLLDGDLDLGNDQLMAYTDVDLLEDSLSRISSENYLADLYPVGAGLIQTPFWLVANGIQEAFLADNGSARNGFIHRLYVSFASSVAGFLALLFSWRFVCRLIPSGRSVAAVLLTFFGSGALIYCFVFPGYALPFSMFTTALFLYMSMEYAQGPGFRSVVRLGIATGLMLLCDWLMFPLLIIPFFLLLSPQQKKSFNREHQEEVSRSESRPELRTFTGRIDEGVGEDFSRISEMAWLPASDAESQHRSNNNSDDGHSLAGRFFNAFLFSPIFVAVVVLSFSPQLFVWYKIYGSWLVLPPAQEISNWPQQIVSFVPDWGWESLFSPCHGLFHWYPILVASLFGLALGMFRRGIGAMGFFLGTCAVLYLHSLPIDWGQEASVGPRSLLGLIPLFAAGTGFLIHELRSALARILVVGGLTLAMCWNVVLSIAVARGLIDLAPLGPNADIWSVVMPAFVSRPLSLFADSLVVRFFIHGPAPLEQLMTLLLMVLFFPLISWVGFRYVLPFARRYGLLSFVSVSLLIGILATDLVVWRSNPGRQVNFGNRAFRSLWYWLKSEPGTDSDSRHSRYLQELRELVTRYPDNNRLCVLLAILEQRSGNNSHALVLYQALAEDYLAVGSQGVLMLSESFPGKYVAPLHSAGINPQLVVAMLEAMARSGQDNETRYRLEEAFLPSRYFWTLHAQLSNNQWEKQQDLHRSLEYHPAWYPAEEALWQLLQTIPGGQSESQRYFERMQLRVVRDMAQYARYASRLPATQHDVFRRKMVGLEERLTRLTESRGEEFPKSVDE